MVKPGEPGRAAKVGTSSILSNSTTIRDCKNANASTKVITYNLEVRSVKHDIPRAAVVFAAHDSSSVLSAVIIMRYMLQSSYDACIISSYLFP